MARQDNLLQAMYGTKRCTQTPQHTNTLLAPRGLRPGDRTLLLRGTSDISLRSSDGVECAGLAPGVCESWVFVIRYHTFQHFVKMEHDYQRKPNCFTPLLFLTTRGITQEPKRRPERAASPGIFISRPSERLPEG